MISLRSTIRLGCCVIRHTCKGREGQDKKAESKRAAAQIKPEETRRKGGFLCDRVFVYSEVGCQSCLKLSTPKFKQGKIICPLWCF